MALLIAGFICVLVMMAVWWRDVIREATFQGFHTPVVQLGLRYGMALFIASEVMFFSAFFWAFFSRPVPGRRRLAAQGHPSVRSVRVPVPQHADPAAVGNDGDLGAPFAARRQHKGLIQGLTVTVLLGLCFTSVQAYEYSHAAFHFTDGIYPSTFFMATGFHGFHVIVGTIFLAVCLWRATQGHFKPDHHFGLEAAAWYWHFVDVVWLFLFVCIYWWGMGAAAPASAGD